MYHSSGETGFDRLQYDSDYELLAANLVFSSDMKTLAVMNGVDIENADSMSEFLGGTMAAKAVNPFHVLRKNAEERLASFKASLLTLEEAYPSVASKAFTLSDPLTKTSQVNPSGLFRSIMISRAAEIAASYINGNPLDTTYGANLLYNEFQSPYRGSKIPRHWDTEYQMPKAQAEKADGDNFRLKITCPNPYPDGVFSKHDWQKILLYVNTEKKTFSIVDCSDSMLTADFRNPTVANALNQLYDMGVYGSGLLADRLGILLFASQIEGMTKYQLDETTRELMTSTGRDTLKRATVIMRAAMDEITGNPDAVSLNNTMLQKMLLQDSLRRAYFDMTVTPSDGKLDSYLFAHRCVSYAAFDVHEGLDEFREYMLPDYRDGDTTYRGTGFIGGIPVGFLSEVQEYFYQPYKQQGDTIKFDVAYFDSKGFHEGQISVSVRESDIALAMKQQVLALKQKERERDGMEY